MDIFFFRNDEVPMWEESPDGGVWIFKVKKNDNIDKMWESLLLNIIGKLSGNLIHWFLFR